MAAAQYMHQTTINLPQERARFYKKANVSRWMVSSSEESAINYFLTGLARFSLLVAIDGSAGRLTVLITG
jgi:hypothetical protein